jgi:predicted nucleic acid-binding protein
MSLMPDSNVWVSILRATDLRGAVLKLVELAGGVPLAMSSISRFELEDGIMGRAKERAGRLALEAVLRGPVRLHDFDHAAAVAAASLAAKARAAGRQMSTIDAMIAGHALVLDVPLLTADARLVAALPAVRTMTWAI